MYIVCDTECYPNYFLARFMCDDGRWMRYERCDDVEDGDLKTIYRYVKEHTLITFNGTNYDVPLLSMALNNATNAQLKEASDRIILGNNRPWHLERAYNFHVAAFDHIDIIELLPLIASLKVYGARNGTRKLRELPIEPTEIIDDEKAARLFTYCGNDCEVTYELFRTLWPQIELRMGMSKQYGVDLRSKSDAQIAETVMKAEYQRMTYMPLKKPIDSGPLTSIVRYQLPEFLWFQTSELYLLSQLIATTTFDLHPSTGKPVAPGWLKNKKVSVGNKTYKVGLGGLHSIDKSGSYYAADGYQIIDIDVASYYPRIIQECGYAPTHMIDPYVKHKHHSKAQENIFTQIYDNIVETRLAAKKNGDKVAADALKIVINGTYGKLGSKYSAIYSPQLMLGVTFTGQLALLMLIEAFHLSDVEVLSANTDGITVRVKDDTYKADVAEWERKTGFEMEETHYKSIHYRDVNNYVAFTTDGQVKTKGIFKAPGVSKNPVNVVCVEAAIEHIQHGKDVSEHILAETDVTKFLTLRTVKGGAVQNGERIGKAVRWYYSIVSGGAIHYESNGNTVARSMGARPMMDLTDGIPPDIDYEWYVREAMDLLIDVGVTP